MDRMSVFFMWIPIYKVGGDYANQIIITEINNPEINVTCPYVLFYSALSHV